MTLSTLNLEVRETGLEFQVLLLRTYKLYSVGTIRRDPFDNYERKGLISNLNVSLV